MYLPSQDFLGLSSIPAGPVGLLFLNEAIKQAVDAQRQSFWTLVIRWYQEVVEAEKHIKRGGHEEQNLYTSCRLLLCTRRNYTPPHPFPTEVPSGHNGYEFPFLFKQDDVSECIQMLKNTVEPLEGPGGEVYFRPSREVGYPFEYGGNVYVARPANFSTAADKMFPLSTDRSRAQKISRFKDTLRGENFGSKEEKTQKNHRIAKVTESYTCQFKGHGTTKGDALKTGLDAFTGLLTQMPSGPLGPSAEAIAPFAFFRGLLTYHAAAAVVIAFRFLNDAKGTNFFAADIALAAEWRRVLSDSKMPCEELCKRLRWLGIAMDNLAIARQLLGFKKQHEDRHEEWEKLEKEDLEMILETALTGRNTDLLQKEISKAKQDGRPILPLAVHHHDKTRITVQDSDKQQIQGNCLDIAKHYGLSEEEFKAYLCLDDVICPFHMLSHEELRERGYDIQMLRAILESSRFHSKCNKDAVGLNIHELDIDNHWDRLLYPIIHETCQQVVEAIAEVKQRHPSLKPGSRDFIEAAKWRTLDRHDFPRVPFQSHAFGYVLAKRGPPNTAMFTGLQGSLFTAGEVRHADDYHHVRSYVDALRTMSFEARISNEIEKSSHPTMWESQFNIHMMVPVDGAYWKVDRALGDRRFDCDDSPDTVAPGPSYRDLELDEPPVGQLLSGQEGPLTFACPNKDCNVKDMHAGEYQLHLNQYHSTWDQRCGRCGRHFPDLRAMEAHEAVKSCLADDAVDDAADFFEEHLSCREDGCSKKQESVGHLLTHEQTHKVVEQRNLPRFRCVCGRYWADHLAFIKSHQNSKRHEEAMAAKGKGISGTLWKGMSEPDRNRFQFYYWLDQSLFYTITEKQISQRRSSSGKEDRKKFERFLARRKRSVNKAIEERKKEGKYKGKKYCQWDFTIFNDEWIKNTHLASTAHKIAAGTFTFEDWKQGDTSRSTAGYCHDCGKQCGDLAKHKKGGAHRNRVAKNAAAAEDPLRAAIEKLKDNVLERLRAPPDAAPDAGKGQKRCDICLKIVEGRGNMYLSRHQRITKYCKETGEILKSIDDNLETAREKIRERLANQPAQAPSTEPQPSSSADATDAEDGGSGPGPSTVAARNRRQREEDAEPAGRPPKRQRSVQVSAPGSPGSMAGGNGGDGEADAMDIDSGEGLGNLSASYSALSIRQRRSLEDDSDEMDWTWDRKGKGKARD